MGLLSLMATLGVNIGPFQQGMDKAVAVASKAGEKTEHELKHKLTKAFTGFAIAETIRRLAEYGAEVERLGNDWQESTDDIQAYKTAADATGHSVEEILEARKRIREGKGSGKDDALMAGVDQMVGKFKELHLAISEDNISSLSKMQEAIATMVAAGKKGGGELVGIFGQIADTTGRAISAAALKLTSGAYMGTGQQDYAEELQAQAELNMDSDYQDSLGLSKKLEARLAQKKGARKDADAEKAKRDAEDQKKSAEELARWKEKIAGIEFQMMDNDQKKAVLEKRLVESAQEYWNAKKGTSEEAKAQFGILDAMNQLDALNKPDAAAKGKQIASLRADTQAGIGGFLGGAASLNPTVDLAKKQLHVQEEIAKNTKGMKTGIFGAT